MDDVTVRPATTEDVSRIRQIAREAWHAAYDDIVGTETVRAVVHDWYGSDRMTRSVERGDGRFFVAVADGETVGFAQVVLRDGDPAWLNRIYVAPDRWNEGIGTRLIERVEAWVRGTDVDRLRLAVVVDAEPANAFYESHGYAVCEERGAEMKGTSFREYVREKEL